jgi:hypothetical protein
MLANSVDRACAYRVRECRGMLVRAGFFLSLECEEGRFDKRPPRLRYLGIRLVWRSSMFVGLV